ncbi:MAG: hypothetical protein ACJA2Y_000991 [Cycloclasticus pugetii]|jgi:hypothetical protein|uniref:hypothetical protein n=1 Tax=Cycloclasticus TaxID=34067 RepID=UPI0024091D51|nr:MULTISPECIES: hypothetical protein [Cycloclasticus]MBV1898783.1 hypothetical protein [Cycloclasticus sp.]MDF1830401.1 hypothetical protein [Cycloclasticus pugetii]
MINSIILLITLALFIGYFLGRNKVKNARQLKRYHSMPVNPNVEKDTEPDSLSERFYCIHRGKGKSCISGYLPEESKK